MRSRVVAIVVAIGCALGATASMGTAGRARADVYACRDKQGVIRFSNRKLAGYRCNLYAKSPGMPKAAEPDALAGVGGSPDAPAPAGTARTGPTAHYAPIPVAGARFSGDEPDDRAGREKLYGPYFEEAAGLYTLPVAFLRGVARAESNVRYRTKGGAGEMGIMQLMPAVAREMGVADPWDPRSNILGGARLLRILADRWKGDLVKVISAYNAGSGAVASADGIPYEATENYVRTVLDYYYQYKSELAGPAPATPEPTTP